MILDGNCQEMTVTLAATQYRLWSTANNMWGVKVSKINVRSCPNLRQTVHDYCMTSADAGQVNEIGYSENSFYLQLQLLLYKSFSKMQKKEFWH